MGDGVRWVAEGIEVVAETLELDEESEIKGESKETRNLRGRYEMGDGDEDRGMEGLAGGRR